MGTDISLEFNGKYIHIIHPPGYEITPKSQEKLWRELSQACRKYKCQKVFAEGTTLTRQMDSTDAIESGFQALNVVQGLQLAICVCEYVPDKTTQLFTNIVHNRGAQVEFFNDKKKALEWLGIEDAESES